MRTLMRILSVLTLICLLAAAAAAQRNPLPDEKGAVAAAQKKLAGDPKNVDLILALGNAQAAVWRVDDALATYTRGLELAPENVSLLLGRGHRYVSNRAFDKALADLDKASKLVDQDAPEHYEIWYHIGVAQYMKGNFAESADAWDNCRTLARSDPNRASATDWSYMTYRRLHRDRAAKDLLDKVKADWKIPEHPYYLYRLLFYRGDMKESEVLAKADDDLAKSTIFYGLGNWYLYNGDAAKAREYFEKALKTTAWPAWGYIGSEVELKRMGGH